MEGENNFIIFDNLVQAVKARKETVSDRKYAQSNASGEPYRPANLDEVKTRASDAGDRFNILFKTNTIVEAALHF